MRGCSRPCESYSAKRRKGISSKMHHPGASRSSPGHLQRCHGLSRDGLSCLYCCERHFREWYISPSFPPIPPVLAHPPRSSAVLCVHWATVHDGRPDVGISSCIICPYACHMNGGEKS